MMTIKDTIDLLDARISRANLLWNFFLVLSTAVVGWLVTQAVSFDLSRRFLLSAVLAMGYFFNFLAIIRVQKEMGIMDADLKKLLAQNNCSEHNGSNSEYARYIIDRSFTWYTPVTFVVYFFVAGCVFSTI